MENGSITKSNELKPKTHILLVAVVLLILNTGLSTSVSATDDSRQILTLLFAVGFNVLTVFWCAYDRRERGEKLGRYFTLSVVVFGIFALFYYFFKTRGVAQGLVLIGKFSIVFFGTVLISSIFFTLLNDIFAVG